MKKKPTITITADEWDAIYKNLKRWSKFTDDKSRVLTNKTDKTLEETMVMEKYIDYYNQVELLLAKLYHLDDSKNEDLNLEV